MIFISTRELSEKWQISESRIVRLAKTGRIPRAELVGKSWVFPVDTEKPLDNRRKENKSESQNQPFRFPLYFYTCYSSEEICNRFSPDERTLYEGEQLFFCGKYQKCCDVLTPLLDVSINRYVRFGALYHICLSNVYLRQCGQALLAYNEIHSLIADETDYKTEMGFLIRNLESYFVGNNYYLEDFDIDMQRSYPLHMREYLLLECAYSDMLKAQYKAVPLNPRPYEIVLKTDGDRFSPLASLSMHLYIGAIYRSCGQMEKGIYHIQESCRIAEQFHLEYSSVSILSKYMQNAYQSALLEQNPAQMRRLQSIANETFDAFHYLFDFIGKNSLLFMLNSNDCMLISFAIKGMTNKEIASVLHLSMNTISKRYSALLEKTGLHSKKELVDWYIRKIKEY